MPPFVHTMQVRYRDTDAQGHVYFGTYLELCDEALSAYMRAIGMPYQDMVEQGTDVFYASANCDYIGSAKFEDTIHIEVRVAKIGNTSITSQFEIRSDGGEPLARADLTSGCVDPRTRQKMRGPDPFPTSAAAFERKRVDG